MLLPEFTQVKTDPELFHLIERTAHNACDKAAKITCAHFRNPVPVSNKDKVGGFDPVTLADQQAEEAIRDVVLQAFPEHNFLGEEGDPVIGKSAHLWVVDPIDGTRSYITGVPLWGTLIAVYDGVDVVLGMLDQPILKERYVGRQGKTEVLTPDGSKQLFCRQVQGIEEAVMLVTSPDFFFNHQKTCFEAFREQVKLTRYGGDCYCYAQLAMGFADIVLESGLKPYDIQAVIPIVEGAGGVVTSWTGGTAVAGGDVVASGSDALHELVLARLAELKA